MSAEGSGHALRTSVVIPCYNAASMIGEAIRSAAEQTHAPLEIIVVDDGSTDGSIEAIRSSSADVRLVRSNRANAAGARNAGIATACGDWVAFLDADSRWYPWHLERAAALVAHGNDVAFYSHHEIQDGDRVRASSPLPLLGPTAGLADVELFGYYARIGYGFPTSGQVIRRDILVAIEGFDASQVRRHDWELLLRVVHGRTWAYDPRPSWITPVPRDGDISSHAASCRYYELRAILKNEARYNGPLMENLIAARSRRAVAEAIVAGGPQDVRLALELASPRLRKLDRVCFGAARLWPGAARTLLRARRAWQERRRR